MNCKNCGSTDVRRSRRHGLGDLIRRSAGLWPYRCANCNLRFSAKMRSPRQRQTGPPDVSPTRPAQEGPAIAFRKDVAKPQAKIVVQAESHEQLNDILLALDRAVSSYQHTSRGAGQKTYTTK